MKNDAENENGRRSNAVSGGESGDGVKIERVMDNSLSPPSPSPSPPQEHE